MYTIVDLEATGGKFNEESIIEIAIYKCLAEQQKARAEKEAPAAGEVEEPIGELDSSFSFVETPLPITPAARVS